METLASVLGSISEIVFVVVAIGFLSMIPGVIAAVILFIKSSKENDEVKRKSQIKKGIFYIALPTGIAVIPLVLYFLLGILVLATK